MMKYKDGYDDEPLFVCSKCLSLNIIKDGKILKCKDCGAGPHFVDVMFIGKWRKLFKEWYGHDNLDDTPSYLRDLEEIYKEQTDVLMTEDEALSNGMKVRDVINIRIKD